MDRSRDKFICHYITGRSHIQKCTFVAFVNNVDSSFHNWIAFGNVLTPTNIFSCLFFSYSVPVQEIPENVFLLAECPHDWLFPQCSAVVSIIDVKFTPSYSCYVSFECFSGQQTREMGSVMIN